MADRSSMKISIGGQVTSGTMLRLAELAVEHKLMHYGGWKVCDLDSVRDSMFTAIAAREPLEMHAVEKIGGHDEKLEKALIELGLTFVSSGQSSYSYPAMVTYWKPGFDPAMEWTGDEDGTPYLSAGEIRFHVDRGTLERELDHMLAAVDLAVPLELVEEARAMKPVV